MLRSKANQMFLKSQGEVKYKLVTKALTVILMAYRKQDSVSDGRRLTPVGQWGLSVVNRCGSRARFSVWSKGLLWGPSATVPPLFQHAGSHIMPN